MRGTVELENLLLSQVALPFQDEDGHHVSNEKLQEKKVPQTELNELQVLWLHSNINHPTIQPTTHHFLCSNPPSPFFPEPQPPPTNSGPRQRVRAQHHVPQRRQARLRPARQKAQLRQRLKAAELGRLAKRSSLSMA